MFLFNGLGARYGMDVVVTDVGWESMGQFQCFVLAAGVGADGQRW